MFLHIMTIWSTKKRKDAFGEVEISSDRFNWTHLNKYILFEFCNFRLVFSMLKFSKWLDNDEWWSNCHTNGFRGVIKIVHHFCWSLLRSSDVHEIGHSGSSFRKSISCFLKIKWNLIAHQFQTFLFWNELSYGYNALIQINSLFI